MTQPIQTSYPLFTISWVTHALEGYTLFYLFDEALADLLALKTYTHGTSPRSYFSILQTGGQPSCGGQKGRGESSFSANGRDKGKFFVGRESILENDDIGGYIFNEFLGKCVLPRMYSLQSSFGEMHAEGYSSACGLLTFVTPTLKFRFSSEDDRAQNFINDDTHPHGEAAYTQQPITQDHLGLYGTLRYGLTGNLIGRIEENPAQFLRGLVKLVILVALATLFLVPELAPMLTGWLMWETAMCVCRLVVPMLAACICPAGPIESEVV